MKRLTTTALVLLLISLGMSALAVERTVLMENFTNGW